VPGEHVDQPVLEGDDAVPLGPVDLLARLVEIRLIGRDAHVGDAPARGEVVDGIPLAPGGVLRLAVAAFGLGDSAGRAVGRPAIGGRPALEADPGGAAGVVTGARGVAAGLALGRPVGRLAAARAVAPGAPLGIALAVRLPLRLQVPPPGADLGAGVAISLAVGRRRRAMNAEAGRPAFGMARTFRGPPVVAARLAHRPAFRGRDVAATDAEAGCPAGLAAPAAALPAGAAPGLGIASAIRDPLGIRPGMTGAVLGPVLLGAGLAGGVIRARGGPAALGADAGSLALGVLPAAALALIAFRLLGIAPRLALRPEPGGPGPVGGAALLCARLAERALRRGRTLAALQT